MGSLATKGLKAKKRKAPIAKPTLVGLSLSILAAKFGFFPLFLVIMTVFVSFGMSDIQAAAIVIPLGCVFIVLAYFWGSNWQKKKAIPLKPKV